MKAGDKVYIICTDKRVWESGKTCTVSKAGRIYFEVEEINSWYKFCVDSKNEDYGNWSLWAKGKNKGERINDFRWYPSEECYLEIKKRKEQNKQLNNQKQ